MTTPSTPQEGLAACPWDVLGNHGQQALKDVASFGGNWWFVECSCGIRGPAAKGEHAAIAAWNARRPAPAAAEGAAAAVLRGVELLWTEAHKEWQAHPEGDWVGEFQDAYERAKAIATESTQRASRAHMKLIDRAPIHEPSYNNCRPDMRRCPGPHVFPALTATPSVAQVVAEPCPVCDGCCTVLAAPPIQGPAAEQREAVAKREPGPYSGT